MTEAWPTEHAATVALHAAAAKAWDLNRGSLPPSMADVSFDELPKVTQHEIKQSCLAVVWAALAALPDPRHGAWAEGYAGGYSDGGFDAAGSGPEHQYAENPYPMPPLPGSAPSQG
jgi:hypothetical protein